jgi:hypothetical protein
VVVAKGAATIDEGAGSAWTSESRFDWRYFGALPEGLLKLLRRGVSVPRIISRRHGDSFSCLGGGES